MSLINPVSDSGVYELSYKNAISGGTFSTTGTLALFAISPNLAAGDYRIMAGGIFQNNVAGQAVNLYVSVDGSQIQRAQGSAGIASQTFSLVVIAIVTLTAGSHSITIEMGPNGSATASVVTSASRPAYFTVERIA